MAYELRDGQGTLFRVTEKKLDTSPDFEGRLHLKGEMWRIAGWTKTSGSGKKWLSLNVSPPRPAEPVRAPSGNAGQPDDDVPF